MDLSERDAKLLYCVAFSTLGVVTLFLFIAHVIVLVVNLLMKKSGFVLARGKFLPTATIAGFLIILASSVLRQVMLTFFLIIDDPNIQVAKEKVTGEIPRILFDVHITVQSLGRAMFMASIVVRCYRLFMVFVVNQRKQLPLLHGIIKPMKKHTQGAAMEPPPPAIATTSQLSIETPLPEISVEMFPASSSDIDEAESASNSEKSSRIAEISPVSSFSNELMSPLPANSPTNDELASQSRSPSDTFDSTTVSRSSRSSSSSLQDYIDRKTNFLKHCTRLYVTIPLLIVLTLLIWALFILNLPSQYIFGLSSQVSFAINIICMCIAVFFMTCISIGVLLMFVTLRKVHDTFYQSKELFFLMITCISSIFTQLGLLSPYWPAMVNAVGSIITGSTLLFAGGIYPLYLGLKFRKQAVDNMVNSMEEMADFLKNPLALAYFAEFARNEFVLENLLFWLEVKKYKEFCRAGKRKEATKAMGDIIAKFMSEKSFYEINVPAHQTHVVMNTAAIVKGDKKGVPPVDLFEPLEKTIIATLLWDSFPRFRASRYYRELNQRLETVREQVSIMT